MRRTVNIIGAGPGGLAAAMLLARSGCDVRLFERHTRVGGRTSSLCGGGHTFDLGPTFFLYPRVLEEIFVACGRDLRREVELVRLDPQYRLIFEQGGELRATPDVARMEQQIAALAPRDAGQFRRFLDDNRGKLAAFRPILESPFASRADLLRPSVLAALPSLHPLRSVDSDLRRYFSDPRVRLAFSFQSKYLGMSPFRCPSLFTILSFLEYEHGVWHPVGGCGAVTAAMGRACAEMGVQIHLGEEVRGLQFDGHRAAAVETATGRYDADALVINSDFCDTMVRLVPDGLRRRWTDRKIASKRFSCSTFMMYLGIEGSYAELDHHTIWLAADYQTNLCDIEDRHCLSENPSFYVQNPSRTDPTLAPKGCSSLYVLVPVTHCARGIDWQKQAPRFREKVLRQLRKVGVDDIERRIRFERVLTPDQWRRDHRIYRGATFNLAHGLGQMLHRRPHNRFEDLDNVYLVGGGTHPGSGLPVIFESARISTRLLLKDLGVGAASAAARSPVAEPVLVDDLPLGVPG